MESCASVKKRGNVWKDYMERMMNEENYWDHNVEGDAVEGPVVCVSRSLRRCLKIGRSTQGDVSEENWLRYVCMKKKAV